MAWVWVLLMVLSAKADQFAIVVDTSASMRKNDKERIAILGALMMADLIDHEHDELIVMPFDCDGIRRIYGNAQSSWSVGLDYPVLRRKDSRFGAADDGNGLYKDALEEHIVYPDRCGTIFSPHIRRAYSELARDKDADGKKDLDQLLSDGSKRHKNNVIIVLTDGEPGGGTSPEVKRRLQEKEKQQLKAVLADARQSGVKIWFVGIDEVGDPRGGALSPGAQELVNFYKDRNQGGFVPVKNNNPPDLLGAYATILATETNRRLKGPKYVRQRKKWSPCIASEVTQVDVVAMKSIRSNNRGKGRIATGHPILKRPERAPSAAGNPCETSERIAQVDFLPSRPYINDVVGTVEDGRGRVARSYRRLRSNDPRPAGTWTFRDTKQSVHVLLLEQYDYDVRIQLRSELGSKDPANPEYLPSGTVRVPVGRYVCIDATPLSKTTGEVLELPASERANISFYAQSEGHFYTETGEAVPNPVEQLENFGSSAVDAPHDLEGGDMTWGKCWKPPPEAQEKQVTLRLTLEDARSQTKVQSEPVVLDIIPPMELNPSSKYLTLQRTENGAAVTELGTGDEGTAEFNLEGPTSQFWHEVTNEGWKPGAKFHIQLGHCEGTVPRDSNSVQPCAEEQWTPGKPSGDIVSFAEFFLDAQAVASTQTRVWSWNAFWSMQAEDEGSNAAPTTDQGEANDPESNSGEAEAEPAANSTTHLVSMTMGRRSIDGEHGRMRLRITPEQEEYAQFVPPLDVVLFIKAAPTTFFEKYLHWLILLGVAVLGLSIVAYSRRPNPLPVGLQLALWEGDPDLPQNWQDCGGLPEHSIEEIGLQLKMTDDGVTAICEHSLQQRDATAPTGWKHKLSPGSPEVLFAGVTYRIRIGNRNRLLQLKTDTGEPT